MKINPFKGALGRRIAALALGVGVAATTFAVNVPAASAWGRAWAGPVDMIKACHQQYGPAYYAGNSDGTAYGWYCHLLNSYDLKPIIVLTYCEDAYHGTAYADPQGGGMYDWGCYYSV